MFHEDATTGLTLGPQPASPVRGLLSKLGAETPGFGRYAYLICKRLPSVGDRNAAVIRELLLNVPRAPDTLFTAQGSQARRAFAITYIPVQGFTGAEPKREDPKSASAFLKAVVDHYDLGAARQIAASRQLDGEGPFIFVFLSAFDRAHSETPSIIDLGGVQDELIGDFIANYMTLMEDGAQWADRPPGDFFLQLRNTLSLLGSSVVAGLEVTGNLARVVASIGKPSSAEAQNGQHSAAP